MEEEKTLAIPLGGSTADGEQVNPTAGPVESAASGVPEQKSGKAQTESRQNSAKSMVRQSESTALSENGKPGKEKKPSVVGRLFAALGALIIFLVVVAVIGGVIMFFLATRDEMPSAPEVTAKMSDVVVDSAIEALRTKEIHLNSDEINLFLSTVKEKSKDKAAEHGIEIVDLFSVIAGDKVTIYSRIRYKGFTWPVRAVARVSYDDPMIIISIDKSYIGNLTLPSEMIMDFVGRNIENENISVYNGMIYYDTTKFNDMITEVTIKQLNLEVDEKQKNDDEDKNAVSKWWDNLVDGIAGWFKNWAAGIVSDLIHDLKFKNVTIIDNELVITVSYAENKD